MKLVVTCPRGCGQFLKKEVIRLGYDVEETQTGFVRLKDTDEKSIAHLNVWTRIGNAVYIDLGSKSCRDFDDYFALVASIDRSRFIKNKQGVVVTASSTGENFRSDRSLQSLGMKAIMRSVAGEGGHRDTEISQGTIGVRIVARDDVISILLDTSGDQLWKRGYRTETGDAPLRENLAVCLLLSLGWRWKEALYDPCSGAGTICIEAAMIAINKAPGLDRKFAFERFERLDIAHLEAVKKEALEKIYAPEPGKYTIVGTDIDPEMADIATGNAEKAGVAGIVRFEKKDLADYKSIEGVICCNPPYGVRLMNDERVAGGTQESDLSVLAIHQKLISLLEGQVCRGGFISGFERVSDYKGIEGISQVFVEKQRKGKGMKNGSLDCMWWKV